MLAALFTTATTPLPAPVSVPRGTVPSVPVRVRMLVPGRRSEQILRLRGEPLCLRRRPVR